MTNDDLVTPLVVEVDVLGSVNVYVQGDLDKLRDGVVFFTVHDVGTSFMSWVDFTMCEDMEQIRTRSLFLHVSIPGQEPGAKEMEKEATFPTIDQIAVNLVNILDNLRIKQVVALGDGAGASILTRFGMYHPNRVHCVMAINTVLAAPKNLYKEKTRPEEENLNHKNIAKFMDSYRKRSEVVSQLNEKIKFDYLLIAGTNSKHVADSEKIVKQMTPGLCSLLKIDQVTYPVQEAPDKVADSLVLFCQGQGLMPTLTRRMSRQESTGSSGGRRSSMSDMDIPNVGRLLIPENTVIESAYTAFVPQRPAGIY